MSYRQWTGEPITEPGIYQNLPIIQYHGDLCDGHSASHTGLDRIIDKSPLHYWDKCPSNPDHEEDESTESMTLGRASHHLFLGQREFQKHFVRRPKEAPDGRAWNGNNLTCKEWLKKQERAKITVLTPEQIDKVARMKVSLSENPMVKDGALNGRVETSFVWRDRETGIWLKARPDVVPNNTGDFVDLKCVRDVRDDALERIIGEYGYHRQAALVLEGAHHLLGLPLKFRGHGEGEGMSFSLIFVETSRPHAVEVITLKPGDIERGMYENRMAIRLLAHCLERNEWPGPSGHQHDARYLGLKPWQIERNTFRVKQIEAMLTAPKDQITEQA